MSSNKASKFLEKITSLCADNASLQSKIGLISLSNVHHTPTLEKSILLYEYLQLFCPIVIFALAFQNSQESQLSFALFYLARFAIPSYWFVFEGFGAIEMMILGLIGLFIIFKYFLFLYIIIQVLSGHQVHQSIQRLWQTIFSLQGRVFYFFTTSFFITAVISTSTNGGVLERTSKKPLIFLTIFIIVVEFAFSIVLNIYYHYILPTKKFLSSKSNAVEMLTLIQKVLIGILIITLKQMANSTFWTIATISVSIDIIRNTIFFTTLPLYNFKALSYQANLLMIITSLDFSCLIMLIIKAIDSTYCCLKLLLGITILLSCCLVFLARNFLQNRLFDLLFNPKIKSPALLIHRVNAIQQLEKFTKESFESKEKHRWSLLANRSLNSENIQKIFGIDKAMLLSIDINSKESLNLLLKEYLRSLVTKYPSHAILQLFAARFFVKKFKLYSEVVNIAKALREKDGIQIKMNAELILIELQNIIKAEYMDNTHQEEIDPDSFVQEQFLSAQLKTSMLEQAKAQLQVYDEMKQENPDVFFILKTAQRIDTLRQNICQQLRKTFASLSEFNLEPLNLTAQYSLALNHSVGDRLHLFNIYSQRLLKYRKVFNQECFTRVNTFQDSVGFVIFSGSSSSVGTIIFATKPVEKIFGGDFRIYPGQRIESRMPPIFRTFQAGFNNFLSSQTLNKITRGFSYTQERYLVQTDYSLHIHPFITHGFYYICICRPVISKKDFMLIHENGDIDSTTNNVDRNLRIQKITDQKGLKINVKSVCPELILVNEAFNIISSPSQVLTSKMTREEAQEIYNLYTTTGKDILLSSVDDESPRKFSYHCKVETNAAAPEKCVKTIILTENKQENHFDHLIAKIKLTPPNEIGEGAIDFDPLVSPVDSSMTMTRRNLLSEATPRNKSLITQQFSAPRIPEALRLATQSDEDETHKQEIISHHQSSKNGSTTSIANQGRSIEVSFKAALNKKTTSKPFRFLCSIFYLTILVFILSQIILRQALIQNTQVLKIRKDILRNAQLRNFLSVSLEGIMRILWENKLGIITPQDYPPLLNNAASLRTVARTYIQSLIDANQELLSNVGSFDQSVNDLLFKADIRIYDTYFDEPQQSYQKLDTFQANGLISDSILAFLNYNGPPTPEANSRAQFIYRNTLNDMILKNEGIVNLLGYALGQQHEKTIGKLEIYRNIALSILPISIVGMIILLWKITLKQKRNLSAFCRLNSQKLSIIEKRCQDFQDKIENGKFFAAERCSPYSPCVSLKINHKRETITKDPNTKNLYKHLKIQIIKLLIMFSVFYTIIFINYNLSRKAVDAFNVSSAQISMNDYLQVQTVLALQTFRELISTNNTAFTCNFNSTQELPLLINKIRIFRTMFFQSLLDSGLLEENAEVHQLLLGDPCTFLDSASQPQCQILKSMGKKTGLIYLLGDLENELNDGLQQYLSSDKSAGVLKGMKKKSLQTTSPIFVIATRTQTLLGNFLDQQLENQLKYVTWRRNLFLGVFISAFIIVGMLSWILVLREFKEGINNFKNLLKLLPAELVLSSFILKTFLMKTSKGALDSIKHNI